jgi:hypothetical protein
MSNIWRLFLGHRISAYSVIQTARIESIKVPQHSKKAKIVPCNWSCREAGKIRLETILNRMNEPWEIK